MGSGSGRTSFNSLSSLTCNSFSKASDTPSRRRSASISNVSARTILSRVLLCILWIHTCWSMRLRNKSCAKHSSRSKLRSHGPVRYRLVFIQLRNDGLQHGKKVRTKPIAPTHSALLQHLAQFAFRPPTNLILFEIIF